MSLLEVKDLVTVFQSPCGTCTAVDGVSFQINSKETLGLVGESGSGKSVTALSILGLVPSPGKILKGQIIFSEQNLSLCTEKQLQQIRGNDISMIFQEPMTSLNPVFTIGEQLTEVIIKHKRVNKKEACIRSVEMLEKVRLPLAEKCISKYPHQLSGGMRQRVMIAMALCCNPRLLIADEPTTALDVTIQAQILELMKALQEEFNMSMLLITHDLGVVAEMVHRVAVIYAGKVVEQSDVVSLFREPLHPYTQGLLKSIPGIKEKVERLYFIPGQVLEPFDVLKGCRFGPRCQYAKDICFKEEPPLFKVTADRMVRCWLLKS